MGGVQKTMQKGFDATKKVLSGKGNLTDFGEMATGMDFHHTPDQPGYVDPLNFDAQQAAGDKANIEAEGQRQYDQSVGGIKEVGTAETQRAKDLFGQMLPNIAENAQAAHLYDSTGYGQEVARQQSGIASQIAEQEAQQRLAALGAKQGFQTGGIQREMSLQDFTNQARVAKAIGAQMAPQAPSSKATGLSGGVAGAGAGFQAGGPYGALLGGAGGYALGSQANKKGGK